MKSKKKMKDSHSVKIIVETVQHLQTNTGGPADT
jgi:hypothetical protein